MEELWNFLMGLLEEAINRAKFIRISFTSIGGDIYIKKKVDKIKMKIKIKNENKYDQLKS